MLSIEYLRLSLPAGMQHRGAPIARCVADELAQLPITHSASIAKLSLPVMQLSPAHSDQQIASQIAKAIHQQVLGVSQQTDTR